MQEKRWVAKPMPDSKIITELARTIGIDSILATLLAQRGVRSFVDAKAFFRPSLAQLHNPFLMQDMATAVKRIEQAMAKQENILIYGDYDVDGTTAVSLMKSYLITRYDLLDTYIPDRYKEGYGVSIAGINYAADNDVALIIALDCGIKAIDQVAYAKEKGIDFIICDHHNPGKELPQAVAVLDPKREECKYPYKELSGCGVGFKLCQALHQNNGGDFKELMPLLDLLAISIGADIVPITGENRTLAYFGLEVLNNNPRPGIQALMASSGQDGNFTITNVVFVLGPRINAAGRIEHGKLAVDLLTSAQTENLLERANAIENHNKTRKDLDRGITEQALQMIVDLELENQCTTVLYHKKWHKGVIGIVASRLIEQYHRPTIVFTKSGDKLAGSARSVPGYNVYEAIEQCSSHLLQFGGHKYAAGMTMLEENYQAFQKHFEEVVSSSIDPALLRPQIEYDTEIKLIEITDKFYRILEQFEPHGPGNLAPTFVTRNLKDTGWAKGVGQDESHLKFQALEKETDTKMSGIAFGFGHLAEELKNGQPFSMAYHVEENHWQGNVSLQLMVKDIKLEI